MEKEYLLIACEDLSSAQKLSAKIDNTALGISILPPVNSLSALSQALSKIDADYPSLIISDLYFSDGDLFTLLDHLPNSNTPRILVIYTGHRFEDAYRAFQYHVDSLLRPTVSAEHLNRELARSLEIHRLYAATTTNTPLQRRDFLAHIDDELFHLHNFSNEMINQRYGTSFQDGFFLALLIKVDSQNTQAMFAQMGLWYHEIESICSACIAQYCCDILYDELSDAVLAFLNYIPGAAEPLFKSIPGLFQQLQNLRINHPEISITLCISKEYSEFILLMEAKANVLDARWARLSLGTNRIIDFRDLSFSPINHQTRKKLDQLTTDIFSAYCRLDEDDAHHYMDEFFHMPASLLMRQDARFFIKKCIDNLFEVYQTQTGVNKDTALNLRHEMIFYINVCFSYAQMKDVFYQYLHRVLEEVRSKQYTPVIREMLRYIYTNYKRSPSLNEVSEQLHYSVPYLSSLFKKETGKNFSDFVASYRIDQAKKLLRNKTKSISNIADELGYKDVRYFSKQFKRNTNLTPSTYRQLYAK